MFDWLNDLGKKIRVTISETLAAWFDKISDSLHDLLVKFILSVFKSIEGDYSTVLKDVVDEVTKEPEIPDSVRKILYEVINPQHEVGALIGNTVMNTAIGGTVQSLIGTLLEPATQGIRMALKPNLPDLGIALGSVYRGILSQHDIYYWTQRMGYKDELIDLYLAVNKPMLDPGTISSSYIRGFINREEFDTLVKQYGYDSLDASLIEKNLWYYPSSQDLIRFAVREVFSNDIIQKYRTDEDYPEELTQYLAKAGLKEEWARAYWREHWQLPSVSDGFEMFHRGLITEEELSTLLRTLDIMPYWRDKVIQLSYNVPARVDVRRMYQLGIRDKKWVYEQYIKQGYTPDDAQALTEYATRGASEDEKDLTKAEVLDGYKRGMLTKKETKDFLMNMGYDSDESDFLITKVDMDKAKDAQKQELDIIKVKYQKGAITRDDAYAELNKLNLTANEVDYYLTLWYKEKQTNVKLPSKADLAKFIKYKIITEEEYAEYMLELGYKPEDVEKYVALLNQGVEPSPD